MYEFVNESIILHSDYHNSRNGRVSLSSLCDRLNYYQENEGWRSIGNLPIKGLANQPMVGVLNPNSLSLLFTL